MNSKSILFFSTFLLLFLFYACKTSEVASSTATISALNCSGVTFSGSSKSGEAFSATATVPYTGGNGIAYSAGTAISSTGVTGLTATLAAGTLTSSTGNLTFAVTGTPATAGTASFAVTFGGQSCNFSLTVGSATATTATITALTCGSTSFSATAVNGTTYTGSALVPYTGGNGGTYAAGTAITSTGVTGLTAILSAGALASGSGNLTFTIGGTPTSAGTAVFAISFGGQSCSLSLTVNAATASTIGCSSAAAAKVLTAAQTFYNALSSSQQSTVQLTYTSSNCYTWSNLPAALSPRKGIRLGDLTQSQIDLAYLIVKAATGTNANEGYDEVYQISNYADDNLSANGGGSSYGHGNYYVAFYGTPSATGTWQFQFTGHHITHNITYKNGAIAGVTPMFEAVEPHSTPVNGVTYQPIEQERKAFADILAGLTSSQLSTAKQSSSFGDLVLGPGQENKYPTSKIGFQTTGLTDTQKSLLLAAIKTYVQDVDAETAACLMAIYESELSNTYIAYSGTSTVTAQGDYVRVDGPSIWIEFSYQGGIIYKNVPHVHSIYRDRKRDYGASFF